MEIVIPPRDHATSTYRYTWDENGEVKSMQRFAGPLRDRPRAQSDQRRINESPEEDAAPPAVRRGRQTVAWPFQSVMTDTEIASPVVETFRRATWQPPGKDRESSSDFDSTIIPDYVVNYIRGETPETVARRKRNGGKIGERDVDIAHQHRPHQSRTAEFEGFYDDDSSRLQTATSSATEEQHILPGGNEKPRRGWRRLTSGWRGGVALNVLLGFIILVTGFICLIVAIAKMQLLSGESAIYTGSCSTAKNINWGLHALINVCVVVLVAGANYVFQVLSSPTRPEVAAAHDKKRWLDIGVPSVRNFAHISNGRVFLSLMILVSAVITQIIYNAVIFTSQSAVDYNIVLVTESFLAGAPFSNGSSTNEAGLSRIDLLALQDLASRNELTNLTVDDCSEEFSSAFNKDFRNVLLVTSVNLPGSSLVATSKSGSSLSPYTTSTGTNKQITLDGSAVRFCLAQPADPSSQNCTVSLNGSLLGITLLLNLVTVVATAGVLLFKASSFEPLVTLGDALTSFLKDIDPTTRDACLLTKTDVWQGRWGLREAKYWVPRDHWWVRTPSLPRWLFTSFLWLCITGMAASALAVTTHLEPTGHLSSLGNASPHAVSMLPASAPASAAALVASLPQVLLGMLYLATNALLTTFFLSHESTLYSAGQRHPLRVSADPEGHQTTSLYLTLPRPVSWLLVALFTAMGFVLSQSCFVVAIKLSPASTTSPGSNSTLVALGFSGVGLLTLLALLVMLAALVLGLAFRRAPPAVMLNGQAVGNPLALPSGSCSAVLSARCHRIPGETDVWQWPVAWGVVHEGLGMEVSHCTYSARGVGQLDAARSYA